MWMAGAGRTGLAPGGCGLREELFLELLGKPRGQFGTSGLGWDQESAASVASEFLDPEPSAISVFATAVPDRHRVRLLQVVENGA